MGRICNIFKVYLTTTVNRVAAVPKHGDMHANVANRQTGLRLSVSEVRSRISLRADEFTTERRECEQTRANERVYGPHTAIRVCLKFRFERGERSFAATSCRSIVPFPVLPHSVKI